ncbi:MAG: hypothetical protein ABSE25_14165 [Syntrophorhabdales bacterium]|jgi:nucleotidyltransferase/DNA polymerase involved in DNA repair
MRIACVFIPHFYLQVERSNHRGLKGPVVIGGTPFDPAPVMDCSEEAAARGVGPGMPLSEAYHLCPEAVFLPVREGGCGDVWEQTLHALGSFALRIESPGAGLAYLDITRSARLYRGEERLAAALVSMLAAARALSARAGVGNSRFLALQAARAASPVLVVPRGMEKAFVAPLSIDALPVDDEAKERLALLGLTTLGKLAALSCRDLCSQFGKAGRPMWEMACAIDETGHIRKRRGKAEVEKEAALEAPLETIGEIARAFEVCLREGCAELRKTGRSCRRIDMVLSLRSGKRLECSLMMKDAANSEERILERVMAYLSSLAIGSAVKGISLSLSDLSRTGEQESLFGKAHLRKKIEGARHYLRERYGEPTLFRVEEAEKDSRLPERRYVFKEA